MLSFKSDHNNFVATSLYCPLDLCTNGFLDDFLVLSGLLSSIVSNFMVCVDINVQM